MVANTTTGNLFAVSVEDIKSKVCSLFVQTRVAFEVIRKSNCFGGKQNVFVFKAPNIQSFKQ